MTVNKELMELILSVSNPVEILPLLIVCAEFENVLKERCQSLLSKKQSIWEEDQSGCVERMRELAEYFGNEKVLAKIQADDSFKLWFT